MKGHETHIINAAAQIEKYRLGELGPIHSIVLSELFSSDGSRVNVDKHLPIVWTGFYDLTSK
jgi:hypothetical protein